MLPDDLQETLVRTAGDIVVAEEPGKAFRLARERYSFTQEWLARHLGIRRETLSRIESGHHMPSLEAVRGFCRLMTLAAGVRSLVAANEARGGPTDYLAFRRLGIALRMPPETVDAVVAEALRSYEAKKASVLGQLHTNTPAISRKV